MLRWYLGVRCKECKVPRTNENGPVTGLLNVQMLKICPIGSVVFKYNAGFHCRNFKRRCLIFENVTIDSRNLNLNVN